jgi:hypothetical protein
VEDGGALVARDIDGAKAVKHAWAPGRWVDFHTGPPAESPKR